MSLIEKSHSQNLRQNNSMKLEKLDKLDSSLKLNLPPLSVPALGKKDKIMRYDQVGHESEKRKISS